MDEFHVVLSSNVKVEGNKSNNFLTKLNKEIRLPVDETWKVTLKDIMYTSSTYTLTGNEYIQYEWITHEKLWYKDMPWKLIPFADKYGINEVQELIADGFLPELGFGITDDEPLPVHFLLAKELYSRYGSNVTFTFSEEWKNFLNRSGTFKWGDDEYIEVEQSRVYDHQLLYFDVATTHTGYVYLKQKIYHTIDELCKGLNEANTTIHFKFQVKDDKLEVIYNYIELIELRGGLSNVLGFENKLINQSPTIAEYSPKLQFQSDAMFIYSDLIQHIAVGDVTAPLLRLVPFKRNNDSGKSIWKAYNPMFVPLRQSNISQIQVEIRTDYGAPFPFLDNSTVQLILEFKRYG